RPDTTRGLGAGVDGGLHAADVAADDRGHERAADADRLDHLDVGGLAHRVGPFDQAYPALGLEHAERLAVGAVSVICHRCSTGILPVSSKVESTQVGGRPTRAGCPCYLVARSARRPPTGAAPVLFALGIIPPKSSWGRAMTWTLITVPTRPAASAPASTAAFTAATSPRTNAVTMPLPALSQPIISTLAAFSIASVPSIRDTSPLHSSRPSASD